MSRVLVSAALLLGVIAIVIPLQSATGREDGALVALSIPEQSLETAIQAFAETSGAQILYETALTAGYRSHPVNGRFTVETALRMLLSGTPLQAKMTADDAFTIFLSPVVAESPKPERVGVSLDRHGHVLGIVQNGILDVLCRSPLTRPGSYRMNVQIWIDVSGRVVGTALLTGTGRIDRDAAVIDALSRLAFPVSPPADLPQPLPITILPRAPSETGDCD